MARPPLTEEQVQEKLVAYCERYGVSPGAGGLPPFPSGQRETQQHREWQTVYRALQRFTRRASALDASKAPEPGASICPVCSGTLERSLAVPFARHAGATSARPASLHPSCAELARLAQSLGPAAVAGLAAFLWPKRTRSSRAR